MTFFTRGFTFAADGQVTNTKLHALVDDAVPQNLDRSHFATTSKIISTGTSETSSPTSGELFYHTASNYLAWYDGSRFLRLGPMQEVSLACQTAASAGDVVVADTANDTSCDTTTTASNKTVIGVLGQAVATGGDDARVAITGEISVNCTSPAVTAGDYLITTTTAGKAASGGSTLIDGAFARAITAKGTGVGPVDAILFAGSPVQIETLLNTPTTATFSTYSVAVATTVDGTWYDVPDAANGTTISTDGTNALDVSFTTNNANDTVFVTLQNLFFGESGGVTATNMPTGIRFLTELDNVIATFDFTTGATSMAKPSGSDSFKTLGQVEFYSKSTSTWYVRINSFSYIVPFGTAGAHTIRVQFQADAVSTTFANLGTATMISQVISLT